MRKIVNTVLIVPLALVLLAFALANRRFVTVSFNPFDSGDPSFALALPLFIVIVAAAMLGVLAGGLAVWFGQRRHRKAARRLEAEAAQARAELAELRRNPAFPAPSPRPGVPPLAIAQDKQHATL
ncbi:LapA family protein [[Pseudomonas] carboxydohydrogena]|uniref:LapA family protein n=1 Tax=Afipia carboxydohydrogena TaxID=290 RepID=A0ABY8BNR6_AFICR|nr:LapA family protein [[Pseudomonas] carboxydohydrogena]WEF51623.1 LapA family protein [[Pseudomonas] carboxydohydrogena]